MPLTYEIVHLAFRPDVTPEQQRASMTRIGTWVAAQPGFRDRQSYFSPEAGRWVDLVTWSDLAEAREAAARAMAEPSLGDVWTSIDHESMSFGHFERVDL